MAVVAQDRGKLNPAGHACRLIGILAARYKDGVRFGGGRYAGDWAEAMEKRQPGAVSVIGKVDLYGELDLVANLDVMISMDSSAMHMASLVGTPVVSIWGATHPYAGFYGFGQDPANAVQLDLSCRPCSVYGNKSCMYGDYRCLERISPETVAEAVGRTVKKRRRKDEEATSQNPEKPKRTVKKPVESPM